MGFEAELRGYLERLAGAVETAHRRIDDEQLRIHLLTRLRDREAESTSYVSDLYREWTPQLGRFARYLELLPPGVAPTDTDRALVFAQRVLDAALGVPQHEESLVEKLEVQRIVQQFEHGQTPVQEYALETRLTSAASSHAPRRLTAVGRVFLRLRGKDAIRWLLTLEVTQSTGAQDKWRAPKKLLEEALSRGGIVQEDWYGEEYFPCSTETLGRLSRLGVLTGTAHRPDEEAYRYDVAESMRDVVASAVEHGPWHATIAALLEDERGLAIPGTGGNATEAALDVTRMIAHEVRNALIPVRHHLDALLSVGEPGSVHRASAARRGVVRVLDFVDQMVATAELVTEPATVFDVADLIEEVLVRVEGGERVTVGEPIQDVRLRAPRTRLVVALSDIVRNALQATISSQPVRISAVRVAQETRISVDDGGPGVPVEQRGDIFNDGFTTRSGGTGFGLANARRIVEGRLQGKLTYEASDLGGARFVLAIPDEKATG